MKSLKAFGKVVELVSNELHNDEFKEDGRVHEEDFTRNRKMNFSQSVLLILSGTKKSLQASVNAFLKESKMQKETYTKQAFSKRRQCIKPQAFQKLFHLITETYYKDFEYKKYRGYRITAIDGTKYNLPNTPELLETYGSEKFPNNAIQVQAQGSCLYDVLNGLLLDVQIHPHNTNEREIAKMHIDNLQRYEPEKELLLLDRGYPSAKLIEYININGYNYLMRCSSQFMNAIKVTNGDEIVIHKFSKRKITAEMRVITFILENGCKEQLITNIFDRSFTTQDFKNIYHLRWGIEGKFDDIKNKLQIESFSGTTNIAILQDFYATMFLSNMAAIIALDCEDDIEKRYNTKELKYQYKLNISMTISTLKSNFIEMMITDSDIKRNKLYRYINNQLIRCVVPIKKYPSSPRTIKHPSLKFPQNRKNL